MPKSRHWSPPTRIEGGFIQSLTRALVFPLAPTRAEIQNSDRQSSQSLLEIIKARAFRSASIPSSIFFNSQSYAANLVRASLRAGAIIATVHYRWVREARFIRLYLLHRTGKCGELTSRCFDGCAIIELGALLFSGGFPLSRMVFTGRLFHHPEELAPESFEA